MCDDGDCCKKVAKFILVVINLFFFLLGLLMLACGIAMVAAPDKVAASVMSLGVNLQILGDANYIIKASGIFMIVLGGIVTVIGGFGFFGACCENKCMLIVYLIIVIIVLLAEVALIIFAAVFPQKLETWVKQEMNKTMITDFREDIQYVNGSLKIGGINSEFGASWVATQIEAHCCGTYGPQYYSNFPPNNRSFTNKDGQTYTINYPVSCCATKDGTTVKDLKESSFVDLQGCLFNPNSASTTVNQMDCYVAVENMIKQASRIAIGIAAAIVGLEIIIIILGFYLCCYIYDSKSLSV